MNASMPTLIDHPNMISIVIPAYNEENGIADIITRVLAIRPSLAQVGVQDMELIVVDDGSADRTSEVVEHCPGTRLKKHAKNRGYGAALKTGFQAAEGNLLAFLDADGTYPPEFFPQLCQAALDGAELVVGSRRSGAVSEMPLVRRIGNLFWANLVSLLSSHRVMDPASGMRVFHSEVLEKLYPLPDGLNFTPVMSTRAVHEGVRLVEVPIPYKERVGRSKLNVVRDGVRFLQTILWTAMAYNPARILGGVGLGLMLVSAIFSLILISMRIAGITTLGPWGVMGTFTAVVAGLSGVSFFALGITFNYIVSLFHKRPIRQGLFGKPILKTPMEKHFWWIGLLLTIVGFALGIVAFILALGDWGITRLWLYLLAGTMMILVGIQLFIFWIIYQILGELSQRETLVQNDMDAR